LGIRGKLFLLSMLLVVCVGLVVGFTLESLLRDTLVERLETDLERHARSGRELMAVSSGPPSEKEFDLLADRLGDATGVRITITDRNGIVLGDSEVDLADISALEKHASRPEIKAALEGGTGSSRRYSTTLQAEMLYVAVPFESTWGGGVVRAAMSLSEVDRAVNALDTPLAVAGVVALVAAALMSLLASHYVSRALRSLVDTAQRISAREERHERAEDAGSVPAGPARPFMRLEDELERAMAALAAERDRFQTALEGMPDAVIALGSDDRITAMNRAAQELFGADEPAQGSPVGGIEALAAVTDLVQARQAGELELELPPGGPRRLLATVTPQPSSVGGCVIVLRDVTELRRLESVRRDFVANVSHEIRTPLTVIQANTETLLTGVVEDPRDAAQFLQAVMRNSERLGRLVSDLLDISRIESGKYSLEPEDVALGSLAQRVVEAFEQESRDRDISLTVSIEDETTVWGDTKALEQVLTNLVQNAVRYSDDGGHVELAAEIQGDAVRIEVRDDGPGIAAEHRSRVFERFYRVDSGRSRRTGGTGLGLSIVKHLVDAMGGEVGVEPRTPRGSIFWLTVPRAG